MNCTSVVGIYMIILFLIIYSNDYKYVFSYIQHKKVTNYFPFYMIKVREI